MKKIILGLIIVIIVVGSWYAYSYLGLLRPSTDVDPYASLSASQLAEINCNLQLGTTTFGGAGAQDIVIVSNRNLCNEAKVKNGGYEACLDLPTASSCLKQASIKAKEYLCYAGSERDGKLCSSFLFSEYKDKTTELAAFKGIERVGRQQTTILKEGERVPYVNFLVKDGKLQRQERTCTDEQHTNCTPYQWVEETCQFWHRLQPIENGFISTKSVAQEYLALDMCEKVPQGVKVKYTYFKLP